MLRVFNQFFTFQGFLSNIINGDWIINFQKQGSFTLEILNNEQSNARKIIKIGYFLYDKETKSFMLIEKIRYSEKDKKIYVYGNGAEAMLNWRIIQFGNNFKNLEDKIYRYIADNTAGLPVVPLKVPNLKPPTSDDNTSEENSFTGYSHWKNELLTSIYDTLDGKDRGFRLNFDFNTKKFIAEVYKVRDMTYKNGVGGILFSATRGNICEFEMSIDYGNMKNKVIHIIDNYALMDDPAQAENMANVDESDSTKHRICSAKRGQEYPVKEAYITVPFIKDDKETREKYEAKVNKFLQSKVKKYVEVNEITLKLIDKNLLKKVRLGDRVTCKSLEYDFIVDTTITSITKRFDGSREEIEITFSDTKQRG